MSDDVDLLRKTIFVKLKQLGELCSYYSEDRHVTASVTSKHQRL